MQVRKFRLYIVKDPIRMERESEIGNKCEAVKDMYGEKERIEWQNIRL